VIYILAAILGTIGLLSLLYALMILARFGQKLGAVTKMPRYYRGYYVSVFFLGVALIARLLRASVFWSDSAAPLLVEPLFYLLLYHLPLAIGLAISLAITWHYWSWLLKER
jgi:hypothetical protein